jgi:hypothetical protein
MVGQLREHLVADRVPEDVVDLLEVVDVDHHDGDVLVRRGGACELAAQALVEIAVVVEAGERVGLRLALEMGADVGVVERERRGIAEPLRQLELRLGEGGVLADAVDVQRALEDAARDQGHDDQRLRVDGRAGHERDAWIEVRLVGEDGLAVLHGPAGDAHAEGKGVVEDLVGIVASHEHGRQLALGLVCLVDVERLVGDDLVERVRDPDEERVEALLGEEIVEDVRQPAVRLRRRALARGSVRRDEPNARRAEVVCRAGRFVHGRKGARPGRRTHRTHHRDVPGCGPPSFG